MNPRNSIEPTNKPSDRGGWSEPPPPRVVPAWLRDLPEGRNPHSSRTLIWLETIESTPIQTYSPVRRTLEDHHRASLVAAFEGAAGHAHTLWSLPKAEAQMMRLDWAQSGRLRGSVGLHVTSFGAWALPVPSELLDTPATFVSLTPTGSFRLQEQDMKLHDLLQRETRMNYCSAALGTLAPSSAPSHVEGMACEAEAVALSAIADHRDWPLHVGDWATRPQGCPPVARPQVMHATLIDLVCGISLPQQVTELLRGVGSDAELIGLYGHDLHASGDRPASAKVTLALKSPMNAHRTFGDLAAALDAVARTVEGLVAVLTLCTPGVAPKVEIIGG